MKLRTVAALVSLALVGCGSSPPSALQVPVARVDTAPAVETLTPESSPIVLRRSLVADEYFWLRAKVLEGEAPEPFSEALAAMKELRQDLSEDPSAWEDLEVALGTASSARELRDAYRTLPDPLRAKALRLARAMEASEPDFRAGPSRANTDAIANAAREITARLLPNVAAVLAAIQAELALPDFPRPLVITLVADAPYPGMFAADARGRASATFVRVRGLDGGALVETLLHATIHTLDEITVRETTAMNTLRGALAQRGIDESDPSVEMAVNTVTFAEAASLVRRYVDESHRPLGESGFYTLFPPAPEIVAAWDKHLEGEPLEATADAIATAVAAAP